MTDATAQLLLVDDDPELLQFLREELEGAGHGCVAVACGQEALLQLRQHAFALVVLDWGLPDFDGVEICRRLRRSGDTTPVLMLTAHDALDERVAALDAGADDYLVKPFALEELLARLRARLRTGADAGADDRLQLDDLVLDLGGRRVERRGRGVELSRTEFDLLEVLVRNAGVVLNREQLYAAVWDGELDTDSKTLDVYVGYLCRKLEAEGGSRLVHTVRGVGYVARGSDR